MTSHTEENIKVCVRIRPELGHENSSQFHEIVKAVGDQTIVFDPPNNDKSQLKTIFTSQRNKDLKFAFDHVFGPETSQLDIYRSTTSPTLDNVLNGYNCCVFAYGATGAGKTYTMLGNKENPGVILRTVLMLYQKIEALNDEFQFDISISYLEIYNERLKDLLNPGLKVDLSEDSEGVVSLRGASTHTPKTADDLMNLLYKGSAERTQTSTAANAESSRSHAIFQIYLRRRPKVSGTSVTWKHAKLSLIDLAGSERGTVSKNNKQLREGANINKSLLALGNVINALADRKKNPKVFVPYRGSKLTRLLKDSLGGSCQTIMIANVSPSSSTYEDTYNTLKYADRAKNIKVKLVANVVEVNSHMKDYQKLIADLKEQNGDLKAKLAEKLETGRKEREKAEFNNTHQMFDSKCREVFRERAEIKRNIISQEAEQYTISANLSQKVLYCTLLASRDPHSPLVLNLQEEMGGLQEHQDTVTQKIRELKGSLEENCTRANHLQTEIHQYIQHNSSRIDKSEQQMLVLLWEYHLTKVQSYFAEHSVRALQQSALAAQRHLQHMNTVTERLFGALSGVLDNKENLTLDTLQQQLASDITDISGEITGGKKRGIMWADNEEREHPSSSLFPSPKLISPESPTLSFTPGKSLVGSTPQLNKLQHAYVHGAEFKTPALAARSKHTSVLDSKPAIQLNLKDKFSSRPSVPQKRTLPRICERVSEGSTSSEESGGLNSTFTMDSPTVLQPAPTVLQPASPVPQPASLVMQPTSPVLKKKRLDKPSSTKTTLTKTTLSKLTLTKTSDSALPKRKSTTLNVIKRNVPRTNQKSPKYTVGSRTGIRKPRTSMIPRPSSSTVSKPAPRKPC